LRDLYTCSTTHIVANATILLVEVIYLIFYIGCCDAQHAEC